MAFTPSTLSVMVQTIGGVGMRFMSYRSDDPLATLTGTNYFARGTDYGLRPYDLIFVSPVSGTVEPYILVGTAVDSEGNVTATQTALDADLTAFAGLDKSDGNIIVGNGTAWVAESGATARASLGLIIGTDVQAYSANLALWAAASPSGYLTTASAATTYLTSASAATTYLTSVAAAAAYQPLDTDLTDIAALTTTTFGRAFLALADEAAFKAAVNLEIGVDVQGYDADTAKLDVEDQTLTGGARVTSKSLGTITSGTVTPDPGDRPLQHYTNGGAHTLAPGSNSGAYYLDITNNGSAGAITTSGWTKVSGDSFTTTNGHKFRCSCSVGDAGSLLVVQAMQ